MSSKQPLLPTAEFVDQEGSGSGRSILDLVEEARNQRIHWDTYQQSHFISAENLGLLKALLGSRDAARAKVLAESGAECVQVVITLLTKVSKEETLRALLALLDDVLQEDASCVKYFHQCASRSGTPSWKPFLFFLDSKQDILVTHLANRILSHIVTTGEELRAAELQKYFKWIREAMSNPTLDSPHLAISALMRLLRFPPYRSAFAAEDANIDSLRSILRLDVSKIQMQYKVGYCFWVLTFEPSVASKLDKGGPHVISELCGLVRATKKEKVARICMAALRNLIQKPEDAADSLRNTTTMVGCKLLPWLQLGSFKFTDEDAQEDATFLEGELARCYDHMSSFDEYRNEVLSGQLDWSPVHRSEKFWRDNAAQLNNENYKLIKILIELLERSIDPQVLAVAAHDIGEYVRYCPRGRSLIERLRGKTIIMNHIQHADESVRYEALICVQKLMTQNWGILEAKLNTKVKA